MRLVIVLPLKLHRVRRHHRQVQPGGQGQRTLQGGLRLRTTIPLNLQIKTAGETPRPARRQGLRLIGIAIQDRLPNIAPLRARQSNQALAPGIKPLRAQQRPPPLLVVAIGPSQKFRQQAVTGTVLHQHQ